jgi:hypothetical protein
MTTTQKLTPLQKENMENRKFKKWTEEEDKIIIKLFPQSSTKAVAEVLQRTEKSISSRANGLRIFKYKPAKTAADINLIHNNEIVRRVRMKSVTDLSNAVTVWYHDIRPSLKRGETISLQIHLDKSA